MCYSDIRRHNGEVNCSDLVSTEYQTNTDNNKWDDSDTYWPEHVTNSHHSSQKSVVPKHFISPLEGKQNVPLIFPDITSLQPVTVIVILWNLVSQLPWTWRHTFLMSYWCPNKNCKFKFVQTVRVDPHQKYHANWELNIFRFYLHLLTIFFFSSLSNICPTCAFHLILLYNYILVLRP